MVNLCLTVMLFFSLNSYGDDLFFTTEKDDSLIIKRQNLDAPYLFSNQKRLNFLFSPKLLKNKKTLEFELVDGFTIKVNKLSLRPSITGGFVWLGRVQGDPTSYVSFVINKNKILGEIYAGGKTYRLSYDENSSAYMQQLVVNKNSPFSSVDDSRPVPRKTTKAVISTESTDNFVDIILALTTEAAANTGAVETVEAMLAATNLMLADSCVNFRYRLLSVESPPYTSGTKDHGDVLSDLTGQLTGFTPHADLVALHSTRDSSGADLVQIFVDTSSIGVCGLAWRGNFGFMRDEYGFSLVLFGCPAFTMAHEFGHNLSLFHDRYQHDEDLTDSAAPGGEHYGFVDTANGFESIMSYNDHCDENGISCDRIGKFSNPRITHSSVPFGLDNFADNTDALNRVFPFVANYRNSVTDFDPDIKLNCSAAEDDQDIHCYIATATYGSYLHPKINFLRALRDLALKPSLWGKNFVNFYYSTSPYLVPYLKKYPALKTFSFIYIESLIFVLKYSWILLLFTLLLLFKNYKYSTVLVIIILISPKLEAQFSMNPFFRNASPKNPSLILDSQSYFSLSPSFNLITASAGPNAVTTIKESGNFINIFTGYGGSSFGINAEYIPNWEKKIETSTLPFSSFETTEDRSQLNIGMAFDLFEYLPIFGISYSSKTLIEKDTIQQEITDKKTDSINIGSTLGFGVVQMGGGIIYNQETGTDKVSNQDFPEAKWISAYLAFAFDFSGTATGFADSGFGNNGFQLEIFYLRDPEVVEVNGVASVVHPGAVTYGAFGQYKKPLGLSNLLFSFEVSLKDQSSVELLSPEATNILNITTTVGYQMGSWLLSASTYTKTQDSGLQTSETGANLGVAYLFSGLGGDYNSSF